MIGKEPAKNEVTERRGKDEVERERKEIGEVVLKTRSPLAAQQTED